MLCLRHRLTHLSVLWLLASLSLVFGPVRLAAQDMPNAVRTADLSVFAGYGTVTPAYYPNSTIRNNDGTFGLNFTRYLGFPVQPSLELRANIADGTEVNEHTFLFGPRVQADFLRHYHPYVDFLVGPGTIHFNEYTGGYLGDNSTVFSYGGGIDVDLIRHFQIKLDGQGQHWRLGTEKAFSPDIFVVGLAYRVPFRPHTTQRDLQH